MWHINFRVGPLRYSRPLTRPVTPAEPQASVFELLGVVVAAILIAAGFVYLAVS